MKINDWWLRQYKEKGAYWVHDGNQKRPHVRLTSRNHSSGFVNSEFVLENPLLLDQAAFDLVNLLSDNGLDFDDVDRVVGPAMGAIKIAHDVSRHIGIIRKNPCLSCYVEKEIREGEKIMVFKRTEIRSGENVLLVEDVITTGGSLELAVKAVKEKGGIVLPYVGALVNRSDLKEVNGKKILSLIDQYMPQWKPAECPLCQRGSEALESPKSAENWARLNAKY